MNNSLLNIPFKQKTAEYFGLTYDWKNIKFHQFIDEKNGCVIFIEKDIAEGNNPLISMTNNGKAKINVIELIRTYAEAPDYLKLANDNIVFQNSGGEYDDLPGNWDMIDGESTVIIRTKTALSNYLPKDYSIQRIMLHEMGHGVDLDGDDGLQLSSNPEVISLIKKLKHSSYYARTKKGNSKYTEEIADAISMVAYKDKIDKSTALIQVPVYDNKGKLVGQEVLDYWRWHERYNKLAVYLENALGL